MNVSVLVTTYGRREYLERCLASLQTQTRPIDQIVLVSRREDSPTEAWIANYLANCPSARPEITWVHVDRPGVVVANNAALPHVRGEILCFIDDDATAHPDWIERLLSFYADETVGGVGGRDRIHGRDGEIQTAKVKAIGQLTWFGKETGNHHCDLVGNQNVIEVTHLKGCNMSFRRGLLPTVCETRLLGNCSAYEIDLCFIVRSRGYRLLYDNLLVNEHYTGAPSLHDGQIRGSKAPVRLYNDNFNFALVLFKHSRGLGRLAVALFLLGVQPLRKLSGGEWTMSETRLALRAKWDALRVLG